MKTPVRLPDTQTLARGLTVVFESAAKGRLSVLGRKLHSRASTFPLEIVRCRLGNGQMLDVVCKYSADDENSCYGHRGGIPYEAAVYRNVLRPSGVSVPRFHGAYRDPDSGWTWLVIEYLKHARISEETTHDLARAASWLGRFHAIHEARMATSNLLNVYDLDYFTGWATRTVEFTRPYAGDLPWLGALCMRFIEVVPVLLDRPATVIHGEFYPKNVLVDDDAVYPVDWEAAAVGPGEIDLASITDKWPAKIIRNCMLHYRQARWPEGAPLDFESSLDVARVYWLFRGLGDTEARTQKRLAKRVTQLRAAAERWRLT
jgi:aminoglycoside phosphotransferase (APT) family kinase protein